ncbi:anti-repressor SinI [Scopulibacillus darangshiensis]|uniref:Anti-repressor SinI n=2 Tax=Scopulibacillus darangshiensis TaxID=442528 RepID=A0A4R2P274_9BACL|nr:anti-repressor SinI [Scopulibacillus darangshiensis]
MIHNEWLLLVVEAKRIGVTLDEFREFVCNRTPDSPYFKRLIRQKEALEYLIENDREDGKEKDLKIHEQALEDVLREIRKFR